jgi:hypothetical protein
MAVELADGALAARKPEQVERFERLRSEFAERYAAARAHDDPSLVEPEWHERNAALEEALLPRPPLRFIEHPSIRCSMFLGDRCAPPELRYLAAAVGERRLARLLEEDPIGGPPLLSEEVAGGHGPTSGNLVHHLHHLVRFEGETGVDVAGIDRVVEWGGGYGSLARLVARVHRGGGPAYTIVDTPLFSALQWLYLASVLGEDRVALHVDGPIEPAPGRVAVVPVGRFEDVPADAELFVSTWALNESAPAAQDAVAAGRWFGARRLLMGMHRGAPLAGRAVADGARVVPVGDFMPAQTYVVR